jgi:hypothetical protein
MRNQTFTVRSPNVTVNEQDGSMVSKYSYENVLVRESTNEFIPVKKELLFKTDLNAPGKLGYVERKKKKKRLVDFAVYN